MPYQFVNTGASTTLAIPSVQSIDLDATYATELDRAPDSEINVVLGDGKPLSKTVRLEFILASSSEAAARTAWNQMVAYAKTASSLERTGACFRALAGSGLGVHFQDFKYFGQLKRARCVLELNPSFVLWTVTKAESITAYNAATKTQF